MKQASRSNAYAHHIEYTHHIEHTVLLQGPKHVTAVIAGQTASSAQASAQALAQATPVHRAGRRCWPRCAQPRCTP